MLSSVLSGLWIVPDFSERDQRYLLDTSFAQSGGAMIAVVSALARWRQSARTV